MKTYKQLEITIKKKLSGDFLGSFQSAFKGLGVEFDSLREYIPGDSIKSIDWKTTAKLGKIHVKNYEEEKDLKILFIIDNSKSLEFGSEKITKKETLENAFFLLAQSAISTGHSIGVLLTPSPSPKERGEYLFFKKGEENIIRTLQKLSYPSLLGEVRGGLNSEIQKGNFKNTLIFYLTDTISPNITELKYLNISNEVILVNIFDYFENNLSDDNFEVDFGKNMKNIFFGNKEKVNNYKQLRKNKILSLKKTLKKSNIEYIALDNRDDLFGVFFKFFNSYKL